jgi:hypothetical protein
VSEIILTPAERDSPDRVIVNKRAAGRTKDFAQLPLLEAALAARRATDGQG